MNKLLCTKFFSVTIMFYHKYRFFARPPWAMGRNERYIKTKQKTMKERAKTPFFHRPDKKLTRYSSFVYLTIVASHELLPQGKSAK